MAFSFWKNVQTLFFVYNKQNRFLKTIWVAFVVAMLVY